MPGKKTAVIPRGEDEKLVKTSLYLTESHHAWALEHGGVAPVVRRLIDQAIEIETMKSTPPPRKRARRKTKPEPDADLVL